jgi:hypothetical protein
MKEIPFNINWDIKVKLNDAGRTHLYSFYSTVFRESDNYKQFMQSSLDTHKADAQGYSRFQLWEFMQIFGPSIYMSRPSLFDLTIILLPGDL